MIRRLAQFWLCWQLLKKKGVKWTKSDFSLLLYIPAQNCKLDLRFSFSKNYRSFDFLSKHNISSELILSHLDSELVLSHLDVHLFGIMHEVDSYQKRFLHGSECTLSFVKPFASFSCEKARAWLFQLPLSFLMQWKVYKSGRFGFSRSVSFPVQT